MNAKNWTRGCWRFAGFVVACCLGCAPPSSVVYTPSPSELRRLEHAVARDAASVKHAIALAEAYRAAGRAADARPLLERALTRQPDEPDAAFLLGVVYEDLGRFGDARRLYRSCIDNTHASKKLRDALTRRLPLLQRRELQAAVRETLAREAELVNKPPTPWTIAIFPYQFVGADTLYKPLGRAIAEMLVTDLSQTSRIKVLERAEVQLLLDEMKLAESGAVNPATAARTGRMLGAERVVQGSLDGTVRALQLETSVVRVGTNRWPGEAAPTPGRPNLLALSERDALTAFIAMEKRTALKIYAALGVSITEVERERVTHRPTESISALLAFGRGLVAEDAGAFEGAARHFAESVALDPSFEAAVTANARASNAWRAAAVNTRQLVATVRLTRAGSPDFFLPNPITRDASAEILRTEGTSRGTTLDLVIIIKQP